MSCVRRLRAARVLAARAVGCACLAVATAGFAAQEAPVTPFSDAPDAALPPPWHVVTLPKIPRHTRYAIAEAAGRRAVRAEADASYASVVHPLDLDLDAARFLRFAWRVGRFPADSDLTTRAGDDLAARVCVLFDVPLDRLPFGERAKIELGRVLFDRHLPAATLCYVWDRTLPAGRWLANAYTDRVRMLVLRSGAAGEPGRWFDERRDVRADFRYAFPQEAAGGPVRVTALAFATDADNTGSRATAWYGDLALTPE